MTKEFITFKKLKNCYDIVVCGGNYPHITKVIEPRYYHCGELGWNCDIITGYITHNDKIYSVAVTLGYRCTGLKLKHSYEFFNKFEHSGLFDPDQFWNELKEQLFK